MEHVTYVEGRGNLLISYVPEGAKGTHSCITNMLIVHTGEGTLTQNQVSRM